MKRTKIGLALCFLAGLAMVLAGIQGQKELAESGFGSESGYQAIYALSGDLAEINRFCIGINEKTYDFDIFYKIAHGYFDSDRGTLKPRLLPLFEAKLAYAKEDYFSDLHHVWARMDRKSMPSTHP